MRGCMSLRKHMITTSSLQWKFLSLVKRCTNCPSDLCTPITEDVIRIAEVNLPPAGGCCRLGRKGAILAETAASGWPDPYLAVNIS